MHPIFTEIFWTYFCSVFNLIFEFSKSILIFDRLLPLVPDDTNCLIIFFEMLIRLLFLKRPTGNGGKSLKFIFRPLFKYEIIFLYSIQLLKWYWFNSFILVVNSDFFDYLLVQKFLIQIFY